MPDSLFDGPACPHPGAAELRTCEDCGFTYCRRCSDDLGCPRCRSRAFDRDEHTARALLREALWVFVAGVVGGEIVLVPFTASHRVAGPVLGLLLGYAVLCCFWVGANWRRLQESLDFSNREASGFMGCASLFAPLLLVLIVPVLVYVPLDTWHMRGDLRRARDGRRDIRERMGDVAV